MLKKIVSFLISLSFTFVGFYSAGIIEASGEVAFGVV